MRRVQPRFTSPIVISLQVLHFILFVFVFFFPPAANTHRAAVRSRVHVVSDPRSVTQSESGNELSRCCSGISLVPVKVTQVQPVGSGEVSCGPRISHHEVRFAIDADVFLKGPKGHVAGKLGEERIAQGEQAVSTERNAVTESNLPVGEERRGRRIGAMARFFILPSSIQISLSLSLALLHVSK